MANLKLQGVLPASVTPFDREGEVDEPALRRHFRDLLGVEGVKERVPVIACINADSAPKAVEAALEAKGAGASAILLSPAFSMAYRLAT